jgi:hypothetical protein
LVFPCPVPFNRCPMLISSSTIDAV